MENATNATKASVDQGTQTEEETILSMTSSQYGAQPYYLVVQNWQNSQSKFKSFLQNFGLLAPLLLGVAGVFSDFYNLYQFWLTGEYLVWRLWLGVLLGGLFFGMIIFIVFILMSISDQNPDLKKWVTQNGVFVGLIGFIAALHFPACNALVSGAFDLQILSCPLSVDSVMQMRALYIPAVIVDNVPRILALMVIYEQQKVTIGSLISLAFACQDLLAMACGGILHLIINRRRRLCSISSRCVGLVLACMCFAATFMAAEYLSVMYVRDRINSRCPAPYRGRNASTTSAGTVAVNDYVTYKCDEGCTTTGKPGDPESMNISCVLKHNHYRYDNATDIVCSVVECGKPTEWGVNDTCRINKTRGKMNFFSEPVRYDCVGGRTRTGDANDENFVLANCTTAGLKPECKNVKFIDQRLHKIPREGGGRPSCPHCKSVADAKQWCVNDLDCHGFIYDLAHNFYFKDKDMDIARAYPDPTWSFSAVFERCGGKNSPESNTSYIMI